MKNKGQFMVISAIIAGLLTITLSTAVTEIQNNNYQPTDLPQHISQLREEAHRITADGNIRPKEERNFRKMMSYIDGYRVTASFNDTADCVSVELESTDRTVRTPCMN